MGLLDAIRDPEFWGLMAKQAPSNLLQAAKGNAAGLLGGPVDLATMVMRPFGYNVEAPVMGSEWIRQQTQQPRTTAYSIGEMLPMGMDDVARVAVPVAATAGGLLAMHKMAGSADNLPALARAIPGQQGSVNNVLKKNDVFGNGSMIEHIFDDGKSAIVQQTLPNGKTVFYPANVDSKYGFVRPDMYRRFDSFEDARNSIKGMRISDAIKKRNETLYGTIPNLWRGDARNIAKKLIDSNIPITKFSSSTQSNSKYIELADGRKIRMSDHDLPMAYENADIDFRYGSDIGELLNKLK